jgi:hypothetical protein
MMSIFKTTLAALVATSMVVLPTVAQAATANQTAVSKLSLRAAPQVSGVKESKIEGLSTIYYVVGAAALIGLGFIVFEKKKSK